MYEYYNRNDMDYMNRIKRTLAVLVLAVSLLPAVAQESTDSLYEFRFVAGKDMFFSPYQGNGAELRRLYRFVERHRRAIDAGELPLHVDGHCNSGRSEQASLAIARTRSNRVKSELITNKGLVESNFITHNHTTEGDFVTVRVILPKEKVSVTDDKQPGNDAETAQLRPENGTFTETTPDTVDSNAAADSGMTGESATREPSPKTDLSLRTNLLRWATLTPDLGIEWRVSRSWGILVNGRWTSWSWDNKNRRYSLWEVSPEVRYYIGTEKNGYIGAMYHVGSFNYKLSGTGKQGDLMGGGLTGGYVLKLNDALGIDFSIGVGCTHADFDRYTVIEGVRVRRGSESKNYWGVNHLDVSLVWNIR